MNSVQVTDDDGMNPPNSPLLDRLDRLLARLANAIRRAIASRRQPHYS